MSTGAGTLTLGEVLEAFNESGGLFSINCISGLVGEGTCRCWRCRDVDPGEEEPGWARLAELASEGFYAEQRHQARIRKARGEGS
jgi:hypothetical protein